MHWRATFQFPKLQITSHKYGLLSNSAPNIDFLPDLARSVPSLSLSLGLILALVRALALIPSPVSQTRSRSEAASSGRKREGNLIHLCWQKLRGHLAFVDITYYRLLEMPQICDVFHPLQLAQLTSAKAAFFVRPSNHRSRSGRPATTDAEPSLLWP